MSSMASNTRRAKKAKTPKTPAHLTLKGFEIGCATYDDEVLEILEAQSPFSKGCSSRGLTVLKTLVSFMQVSLYFSDYRSHDVSFFRAVAEALKWPKGVCVKLSDCLLKARREYKRKNSDEPYFGSGNGMEEKLQRKMLILVDQYKHLSVNPRPIISERNNDHFLAMKSTMLDFIAKTPQNLLFDPPAIPTYIPLKGQRSRSTSPSPAGPGVSGTAGNRRFRSRSPVRSENRPQAPSSSGMFCGSTPTYNGPQDEYNYYDEEDEPEQGSSRLVPDSGEVVLQAHSDSVAAAVLRPRAITVCGFVTESTTSEDTQTAVSTPEPRLVSAATALENRLTTVTTPMDADVPTSVPAAVRILPPTTGPAPAVLSATAATHHPLSNSDG